MVATRSVIFDVVQLFFRIASLLLYFHVGLVTELFQRMYAREMPTHNAYFLLAGNLDQQPCVCTIRPC